MTIVIFLYKDGLSYYNRRIYGHQTTGKEYLMAKTADTIAIYSRKSRYTGKGESIGNQIDLCREYIRTHYGDAAAEHAVVFEDEGFSGGNLNRPDFKKMMTAAKERKIRAIVVYRLDRISRNKRGAADRSAVVLLRQPDVPQGHRAQNRRRTGGFSLYVQVEGAQPPGALQRVQRQRQSVGCRHL